MQSINIGNVFKKYKKEKKKKKTTTTLRPFSSARLKTGYSSTVLNWIYKEILK